MDNIFQPLISILINNYNYGKFVSQAISSALSQTYPYKEVIVVDDGSTDNSWEVITSYKDRIIAISKRNGGQASAFNAGFAACRGEIIFFLDSDDTFFPNKVEEIVSIFESNLDIAWCFHPLRYIDVTTNKFIADYPPSPQNSSCVIDFRSQMIDRAQIPVFGPATSALCIRRSVLEQILPMPEVITIESDNYLRYATLLLGKGFFLNKALSNLRIHGNNSYSLRTDKGYQKARVLILTAYWLRARFPQAQKFANKQLGMGLGGKWWFGASQVGCEQEINEYFSNISLVEKFEINLRASHHWLKNIKFKVKEMVRELKHWKS